MNHQNLLFTGFVEGNVKRFLPHPWTQNTHKCMHMYSHMPVYSRTPPDPSSDISACSFSSGSIKGNVYRLEVEQKCVQMMNIMPSSLD